MNDKTWRRLGWAMIGAAVIAAGCARERDSAKSENPPATPSAAPSAPEVPETKAQVEVARPRAANPMVAASPTGSTIQLARVGDRNFALIMDEDARALRVVDALTLKQLSSTPLSGRPAQLVVASDGRAYVALRDEHRVAAFELSVEQKLTEVASIDVANEPVALATDPKGATLVVTAAWAARLQTFDVTTHRLVTETALGREPRGVAVSSDGKTAHVAHAVGSKITKVALGSQGAPEEIVLAGSDFNPRPRRRPLCRLPRRPHPILDDPFMRSGMNGQVVHERDAVQGFAVAVMDEQVFVPQVLAHRGEIVVGGYGGSSAGYPPHQPTLAVVDGEHTWLRVAHQVVRADKSRHNFAGGARRDGCFLPRAAAVDAASKTVLIACQGTNEVRVVDAAKDKSLTKGTKARWKVPAGPTGIAVDSGLERALVWSQFSRKLTALPLVSPTDPNAEPEKVKLDPFDHVPMLPKQEVAKTVVTLPKLEAQPSQQPKLSAIAMKGRELFHGAGDKRISADGRACASCHPDGREDGLTWPTPFGARQTPMLAGRLDANTVPYGWQGDTDTVKEHVKQTFKRLGGTGLDSADLDALIAYCREMPTPPRANDADPKLVAAGKELFFADTVGCGSCHTDGPGSDGSRHDVGSGPKLDTPSLAFVSGTAPYFHDGRYQTLGELLEHSQGKMGWGSELTKQDRNALEAYLRTL